MKISAAILMMVVGVVFVFWPTSYASTGNAGLILFSIGFWTLAIAKSKPRNKRRGGVLDMTQLQNKTWHRRINKWI